MNGLLYVAILVVVMLIAVIAVQSVKYKNLVLQTEQSKKDLQEKEPKWARGIKNSWKYEKDLIIIFNMNLVL